MLYPPGRERVDFCAQTDPKITKIITKGGETQTQKICDLYKEDWYQSKVFKRALRAEALKRGLE